MQQIQPIILCGGSGSRLWPLSRTAMPKPFIPLSGEGTPTLFQQTALRVQAEGILPPVVICAEAHRFYVVTQLAELGITPASVILEPAARNTTAAIALASQWATTNGCTAPLAILPADHLMGSPAEFQTALHTAARNAGQNIVLFGINPSFPNTEYGYIQLGEKRGAGAFKVEKFLEKPTRAKAEAMLLAGNHVWNSGIFSVAPALLATELQNHSPAIATAVAESWRHRLTEVLLDTQIIRPAATFAQVPAEQFDTSVMEKTSHAVVLPYTGRWSDIGGFAALSEALPQSENGNSVSAPAGTTVLAPDTTGTLIHAGVPGKIIAVHGMVDVVVVDTHDALLVTTKSRAAGVKAIFQTLQRQHLPQAEHPHRVHRPWGWYETIVASQAPAAGGTNYLVKRIGVVPGGRLSLQYHHHRAEHWTVVIGTATITKGTEILTLGPDQSTYLPLGTHHRLENCGTSLLEIIEVQTGSLLSEDDIVRLDDIYNRA